MTTTRDILAALGRFTEPLHRRLSLLVARGTIDATDDTQSSQTVTATILEGEKIADVERPQRFGFSSVAPVGSEVVVVFQNGDRSMGYIVADVDRTSRPVDLAAGESAQYSDVGTYIKLRSDKSARVRADKLQFQGATDELMTLLSQVIGAAQSVATTLSGDSAGGDPLANAATYGSLASTLGTIKGKLDAMKV